MRDWLDSRTGFRSLLKHLLDEPLPQGVGWWFVTGSIVLFLLTVQSLTGVLLAVFFLGSIALFTGAPYILGAVSFGMGVLLMGFEIFVAGLQAFIFAVLTASYIGGAMAEEH